MCAVDAMKHSKTIALAEGRHARMERNQADSGGSWIKKEAGMTAVFAPDQVHPEAFE